MTPDREKSWTLGHADRVLNPVSGLYYESSGLREDAHLNFFNGQETTYFRGLIRSPQACSFKLALSWLLAIVYFFPVPQGVDQDGIFTAFVFVYVSRQTCLVSEGAR